ncbi:MAG: hypothetical protein P8J35_03040, partial [Candidatus Marinimicrobia bacterium]|nr:hypothetical protein [Candidatus Neomarinimicrobiota bacterium]
MNKLITKYFYFILLSGSSLLYSQNYSLSFDGQSGHIRVSDDPSLNFGSSSISYSLWFKIKIF